jgi:hypothetical protein
MSWRVGEESREVPEVEAAVETETWGIRTEHSCSCSLVRSFVGGGQEKKEGRKGR